MIVLQGKPMVCIFDLSSSATLQILASRIVVAVGGLNGVNLTGYQMGAVMIMAVESSSHLAINHI